MKGASILLISALAGCGAAGHASSGCRSGEPSGRPSQLTLADTNVGGAQIDPPIGCDGAWYVRLWREGGERPIATARAPGVCTERPGEDDECGSVDADALLQDAVDTLESQGIDVHDIGPGPCGGGAQSIAIADWAQADEAVRALAQTMERWDVQGQTGVAIRAPSCAAVTRHRSHRGG